MIKPAFQAHPYIDFCKECITLAASSLKIRFRLRSDMQASARLRPLLLVRSTGQTCAAPGSDPVHVADLAAQLQPSTITVSAYSSGIGGPRDVRSLRLLDLNGAAERELGTSVRRAVGKAIIEAFPALLKTPLPERCRTVIESGIPETVGEVHYADSRAPERVFWFDCFPLPGNCVGSRLKYHRTKRSELTKAAALELLHRITVAINGSTVAANAAQVCLRRFASKSDGPWAACFLPMSIPRRGLFPTRSGISAMPIDSRLPASHGNVRQDLTNKFVLDYRMRQGTKLDSFAPWVSRFWKATHYERS